MAYDDSIASATLAGSLLSCFATSCVLISFAVYRAEQRSFRDALVLNLTLAEFLNSLNNSVSGIIYVHTRALQPGPACTFNGWLGQLSVQAADFSILAIALVTLLTITRRAYMPAISRQRKIAICASVWLVPLLTSSIATGLGAMRPVSGNWCWISGQRPDLRYSLTHGWRFAVIFSTILIYLYVWWYLGRHFHSSVSTNARTTDIMTGSSGGSGPVKHGWSVRPASFRPASFRPASLSLKKNEFGDSTLRSASSADTKGFQPLRDDVSEDGVELELADSGRPRTPPPPPSPPTPPIAPKSPRTPPPPPSPPTPPIPPKSPLRPKPTRPSPQRYSRAGFGMSYFYDDESEDDVSPPASVDKGSPPASKKPGRKSVISWAALPPSPMRQGDFAGTENAPVAPRGALSLFPPRAAATKMTPTTPTTPPPAMNTPTHHQPTPPSNIRFATSSRRPTGFANTNMTAASEFPIRRETRRVEREVKRMMLLNAYPILYVLLWIPGLINRLLEASGKGGYDTLYALQSSSQFVGLANALTYGFNRHVRHRIQGDLLGGWLGWLRRPWGR